MKTKLIFGVAVLAVASTMGCNVSDKLDKLGLKQGDGVVEKGVIKYDTLVDRDVACEQAWADVDATIQRRADLIPNLVAVAKGYAAHERATLDEVIAARASATQVKLEYKQGVDDFSDPAKMQQFQAAQGGLTQALGKLMVVQEKYPDLKANEQFNTLMTQMEGTENRILQARRVYNAAVAEYNKELRHVSGKIINPITGMEFKQRVMFTADADARNAPKVDFGSPATK
jgi:LemA protein